MTLINWQSKEVYIQDKIANGEALDMREEFHNTKILSKLQQLKLVYEELTELLVKYLSCKDDIDRLAQLTILLSNSIRNHQMGQQQKAPIEHDEIVNNCEALGVEYDITYNQEDGKLYIAYNGKKADGGNSEVILQFISLAKHPNKDKLIGLNIDRTRTSKADGGRSGLLSGLFYIENLPIDMMEKLPTLDEDETEKKIDIGKEHNLDTHLMTFEKKMDLEGVSGKVVASLRAMAKVDKDGKFIEDDIYGLRKSNPPNLKPPQGLSRTEKKEFWDHLRKVYPDAFHKGGNWIGYGHESNNQPAKEDPPAVHKQAVNTSLGLLTETGAGNLITSITDTRVDERTCFIGRYFEQKRAYAIASTPTKIGAEQSSAMLFFEKDRTAGFVLQGLLKSPSWEQKLEGCQVYKASTLNQTIRSDRNRTIYFITNAVTALQALGTQKSTKEPERDIIDADYEVVKD